MLFNLRNVKDSESYTCIRLCRLFNYLGLSVNHSGVGRGGVMEPLGGMVRGSGGSLGKNGWRGGKMAGGAAAVLRMGYALMESRGRKTFDCNYSAGKFTSPF